MLLAEGRLPECWIPPGHILECRALLELYHDLRAEHTAWAQRIHAVLFHQGAPALGEGTLRTEQGLAALRAAAAALPVPGRAAAGRHRPGGDRGAGGPAARGAAPAARRRPAPGRARRSLAARLYGVGPVTALAMTCWLGGAGRFSSSRQAVRFAGLDVTVCSSDRKGPPGRLSRQGPPVLRWAVYEAGKTHARTSAPDHRYYAQVKDRKQRQARRAVRGPQDPPAGLPHPGRARRRRARRRLRPPRHGDQPVTAPARPGPPQPHSPMGTTAASSRRAAVSRCRPCPAGPGGRPD